MRDRPLLSGCLIGLLIISICMINGGAGFMKNLCPSVLQKAMPEKSVIRVSGQVYKIDVKADYYILFLKNNSIIYQNDSFEESKIMVYDDKKQNIKIGNQIEVTGKISFYEQERNPGNFNQKLYYQKQGIYAFVWASHIGVVDSGVDRLQNFLHILRMQWKYMLEDVIGKEAGSVLAAMLLAEKNGMNEETKELYQANGIGHILAISGLHLSVMGVGLYNIFRKLSGSFVTGGIVGISVLILYILMIGMTVSVLRALIMFMFRVGADMAGRHYDSPTALGAAAFVTIIWNPLYLYDGGFWLSYGAILAIILILPMFGNLMFQSFWTSVSINVLTLPILLYFFYEMPLYSVFLNMVVIPFMTLVLVCGLGGSLCCAIFVEEGVFGLSGLGGAMLKICKIIIDIYEKICNVFLDFPGARMVTGQPGLWQIAAYYSIVLAVVIVWKYWKKRNWIIVFGIMVVNCAMIMLPVKGIISVLKEELSITVLDVGQGDGIFIRGPEGNTYLVDGGSSDVKKVGQYRMEPFLKSQGVKEIDYVFVSHGDGDHINGISEMIERTDIGISIETIVFPDEDVWDDRLKELAFFAMKHDIRVVTIEKGQELVEGGMKLECLGPGKGIDMTSGGNAASMVLALNYGEFDMLLTGDVEAEGEEKLTEVLTTEYQKVNWEVLKVAHHGSKNSSGEHFLEVIKPLYSLVSAGKENRYGHPSKETIRRLSDIDSTIISTQENGAIKVVTDGRKMKVRGYVKEEKE